MVLLTAAAPVLSGARANAEAWIQEHAECSQEVQVPPEVAAILSPRLRMLAAQHQVDLEMRGSAVAVHGPEVCVAGVQAELKELIEQHAITEAGRGRGVAASADAASCASRRIAHLAHNLSCVCLVCVVCGVLALLNYDGWIGPRPTFRSGRYR